MDLTLIIPVYNEVENLAALVDEIHAALDGRDLDYEMLFIDDGSRDGGYELLRQLQENDPRLVILRFRRNFGQTAAFAAGFDHARGRVLVTLDADRQNDPADIPALLDKLAEGHDVVNGWRQNRQDNFMLRKLPSYIANRLIARITHIKLHDRGCSLRAFRAEAAQELRLYGEMHRFIPELLAAAGFTMAEIPVNHRPRAAGRSKYGLSRTFRVLLDLLTVFFIRRYGDRPMHFLGAAGLIFGGLGTLIGLALGGGKIWAGLSGGWPAFHAYQLSDRPLLLLAVLLVILGSQFLVMGLLAELVVRTYYESQNKPVYQLKVSRESRLV
jgi:glycosyltransferase involved in cell wall biosynthesis